MVGTVELDVGPLKVDLRSVTTAANGTYHELVEDG